MPNRSTDYSDLRRARERLLDIESFKYPSQIELLDLRPLAVCEEDLGVIEAFQRGCLVHQSNAVRIESLRKRLVKSKKELSIMKIKKQPKDSTIEFNGHKIHYSVRDGVVMVNATETAKPYGKLPKNFLALDSTKEYQAVLESDRRIPANAQVEIVRGGNLATQTQGTWLHHKLALRFAGWLDVKLQIWMDEQVESILRGETISLKPKSPAHILLEQAQLAVKHEEQLAEHEQRLSNLEAKTTTSAQEFYTIAGYASLMGQKMGVERASQLGRKASKLSRDYKYSIGRAHSEIFGEVNTYHIDILKIVIPECGLVQLPCGGN